MKRLASELIGALVATALAATSVSHLVSTNRAGLLFHDGDSVLLGLMLNSWALGQPQDWVLSPVLFLPELAVYGILSLLGLGTTGTITVNALVNFLAYYVALRYVLGSFAPPARAIPAASAATLAFHLFVWLDSSADRNGFELASLLATTTYYSATVIGTVLAFGLVARLVRGEPPMPVGLLMALGILSLVSTMTNPIYLAWAVVPLVFGIAVVYWWRSETRKVALATLLVLMGSSLLGLASRQLFADVIVGVSEHYVRPQDWQESLKYYGAIIAGGTSTAPFWTACALLALIACCAAVATRFAFRQRDAPVFLLAGLSWVTPVIVSFGAVAVGTVAARYLQPVVFVAPVAVGVLLALALERTWMTRRAMRVAAISATAVAGIALVIATMRVPPEVEQRAPGADIACVVGWIEETGLTGVGQFWTVRAPKLYLDDPSRLVQVDYQMRPYEWLVNRTDYLETKASFLVTDWQSYPFTLPPQLANADADIIECGSYQITWFPSTSFVVDSAA